MTVSEFIKNNLEGRTLKYVYKEIKKTHTQYTSYENFIKKMTGDRLTAYDLIYICKVLNIDINVFKNIVEQAEGKGE